MLERLFFSVNEISIGEKKNIKRLTLYNPIFNFPADKETRTNG